MIIFDCVGKSHHDAMRYVCYDQSASRIYLLRLARCSIECMGSDVRV